MTASRALDFGDCDDCGSPGLGTSVADQKALAHLLHSIVVGSGAQSAGGAPPELLAEAHQQNEQEQQRQHQLRLEMQVQQQQSSPFLQECASAPSAIELRLHGAGRPGQLFCPDAQQQLSMQHSAQLQSAALQSAGMRVPPLLALRATQSQQMCDLSSPVTAGSGPASCRNIWATARPESLTATSSTALNTSSSISLTPRGTPAPADYTGLSPSNHHLSRSPLGNGGLLSRHDSEAQSGSLAHHHSLHTSDSMNASAVNSALDFAHSLHTANSIKTKSSNQLGFNLGNGGLTLLESSASYRQQLSQLGGQASSLETTLSRSFDPNLSPRPGSATAGMTAFLAAAGAGFGRDSVDSSQQVPCMSPDSALQLAVRQYGAATRGAGGHMQSPRDNMGQLLKQAPSSPLPPLPPKQQLSTQLQQLEVQAAADSAAAHSEQQAAAVPADALMMQVMAMVQQQNSSGQPQQQQQQERPSEMPNMATNLAPAELNPMAVVAQMMATDPTAIQQLQQHLAAAVQQQQYTAAPHMQQYGAGTPAAAAMAMMMHGGGMMMPGAMSMGMQQMMPGAMMVSAVPYMNMGMGMPATYMYPSNGGSVNNGYPPTHLAPPPPPPPFQSQPGVCRRSSSSSGPHRPSGASSSAASDHHASCEEWSSSGGASNGHVSCGGSVGSFDRYLPSDRYSATDCYPGDHGHPAQHFGGFGQGHPNYHAPPPPQCIPRQQRPVLDNSFVTSSPNRAPPPPRNAPSGHGSTHHNVLAVPAHLQHGSPARGVNPAHHSPMHPTGQQLPREQQYNSPARYNAPEGGGRFDGRSPAQNHNRREPGGARKPIPPPLRALLGTVVPFSRTQKGSLTLQDSIAVAAVEDQLSVAEALEEVLVALPGLAIDSFGNYVVQKLLELSTRPQARRIAAACAGTVVDYAENAHGCRVLQRMIAALSPIPGGPRARLGTIAKPVGAVTGASLENTNHSAGGDTGSVAAGNSHNNIADGATDAADRGAASQSTGNSAQNDTAVVKAEEVVTAHVQQLDGAGATCTVTISVGSPGPKVGVAKEAGVQSTASAASKIVLRPVGGEADGEEVLSQAAVAALLEEIRGQVLVLVYDQHANHVISAFIEHCAPAGRCDFLLDELIPVLPRLSRHPFGCRVVQRLAMYVSSPERRAALARVILAPNAAPVLASDIYGNFVVQTLLEPPPDHLQQWPGTEGCRETEREEAMTVLLPHMLDLATTKCGSQVVEKLIIAAAAPNRTPLLTCKVLLSLMAAPTALPGLVAAAMQAEGTSIYTKISQVVSKEVMQAGPLSRMMTDGFGNYTIQRLMEVCGDELHAQLLGYICLHTAALSRSTHGRRFLEKTNTVPTFHKQQPFPRMH